jgi:potassium/hydrogen antiporter
MEDTHSTIFVIGVLGVLSILASAFAMRFKAPLLLVFLGLGMLAGSDGPGGIVFNDFYSSYFFGSLALTVILFNGGLKTERAMVSAAIWPSVVLATLGVFVSAAVISVVSSPLFHLSWTRTLLIGAAVAPTDAAAVATLLKIGAVKVPFRVAAILEMESGLNDPISVFLMIFAVDLVLHPATMTLGEAGRMVLREMLGGAAIGVAGGSMLLSLLKILKAEAGIFPVLAFSGALMIFGGAQLLGTSGFLAIYIAAYIVGRHSYRHEKTVQEFFDAFAWVAQIGLFLLLGLLVTPHDLWQIVKPAMVVSVCLILFARPIATFVCLTPFRVPVREMWFISWVGLRGAVPIYLTLIPVLAGLPRAYPLFSLVFVVVVTSLVIQGWTVGLAARVFGFNRASAIAAEGKPQDFGGFG